jgi:tubulin epsilon
MRFGGSLNLDINEMTTNFIPFPMTNFLLTSLSPFVYDRAQQIAINRSSQQTNTTTSVMDNVKGGDAKGGGSGVWMG